MYIRLISYLIRDIYNKLISKAPFVNYTNNKINISSQVVSSSFHYLYMISIVVEKIVNLNNL